ncbi:MAG: Xaa-Pro peptidase family protein [Candidatus Bathyarchaeota archaeon]|nr:Xaa-Pro peptidase family protein [Candidatus Bathyarchaeota archaeon]
MSLNEEFDYEGRVRRARDLMQKYDVDCLYLVPGRNQRYFSGYTGWGGWPTRLGSYLLPLEGDPVRVTIPMYVGFIMGTPRQVLGKTFYLYTDGDEATAKKQVRQALKDLKVERGTIGVEEEMRHTDYLLLNDVAPEATIKNVSQILLDPLRMIKDKQEIAKIRKSAQICDHFFKTATEVIGEGSLLNEVRLELAKCIAEAGADSSRIPRLTDVSRRVRKGDVFDVEPGITIDGYYAEASRTFFVGEATEKEQIIWKVCMKAYDEIESLIRPGVTMHQLDVTFKKSMREGLREVISNFKSTRRLGHGVGLVGGHEIPLVQEFNMMKAAPGMVFAIDAGPGPGAIKKQDCSGFGHGSVASGITSTILITENGFKRLDTFTHDMIIL